MQKRNIFLIGMVAAAALLFWYFSRPGIVEVNRQQFGIMDTVVNVRVYTAEEAEGEAAIDQVLSRMEELEGELSRHIPGSPVDTINRNAGREAVQVTPHVLFVIQKALEIGGKTGGAFDITVAPLMDLWGFGTPEAAVPASEDIGKRLPHIDYTRVQVSPEERKVFLPSEEMALDLGGVAKGYIVDQGIAVLTELGIESAYLDAGGDIRVLGSRPDGKPWRIGIRHPRDRTTIFAVLPLDGDLAVVTSGDYQRYFDEGSARYHHILNPATGYPAQSGAASVTVIAPDTITADILSTAFFVMGVQESIDLTERIPGVETVIISPDLQVYMSSGVKDSIELQ